MYKILSLDGGGTWALIQLLTLQDKYGPETKGHDILRQFDLVIANSGGSMTLACLAQNWTLSESIKKFKETGKEGEKSMRERIFTKNKLRENFFLTAVRKLLKIIGPKYDTTAKIKAFNEVFTATAKMKLHELPAFVNKPKLRIIISTFNAQTSRAKFFKSYKIDVLGRNLSEKGDDVTFNEAIHGSSNAPVNYFDFPAQFKDETHGNEYLLWDGALGGFNNPLMAGLIEACKLGTPPSEMYVVSLGTGNKVVSKSKQKEYKDAVSDAKKNKRRIIRGKGWKYFKMLFEQQAQTILFQPPDWANYVALFFLSNGKSASHLDRFVRLSPLIDVDEIGAQGFKVNRSKHCKTEELIERLYDMEMDVNEKCEIDTLQICFTAWTRGVIKNQSIAYKINKDKRVEPQVGDTTYEKGMERWKAFPDIV